MKQTLFGISILLLALAAVRGAPEPQNPPESRILVLDFQQVLKESQEWGDFKASLNQKQDENDKQVAAKVKQLQTQEAALQDKDLNERDETFYKAYEAAKDEEAKIKNDQALFKAKTADDIARKEKGLMLDARLFANQIRKERGAEIVLTSKMGKFDLDNPDREYVLRHVLACDDSADITKEVVSRMNKKYKDQKK